MAAYGKEPPTKKRKIDESQITDDDIDELLEQLEKMGAKSNLVFQSEGEDKLNPVVLYNENNIIPLKKEIISAIQKSQCLIAELKHFSKLIADFIITDYADTHFTTEQFLEILCAKSNIGKTGGFVDFFYDIQKPKEFLLDHMLNDIDRKRSSLTEHNIMELSGVSDEEETEINFDFIEFMNNHLMDVSIITLPTDSEWEFSHYHWFVGRTKEGHITGYQGEVVWT